MTSKTVDPDAVEINRLFRQAQAFFGDPFHEKVIQGSVTDKRRIPRNISLRRNGQIVSELSRNKGKDGSTTPDACHYCRDNFKPGQTRFVVVTGVCGRGGWGQASLCMDCFKGEDEGSVTKLRRAERACKGCGELINTAINARKPLRWEVCSDRCYQRVYRKRRRGQNSVIDWKGGRSHTCTVCKKFIDRLSRTVHKRRDAIYCSPKCRQKAYRRRKEIAA